MELSKFEKYMDESWLHKLEPLLTSEYMENLLKYLSIRKKTGKNIYPAQDDIFKIFKVCPFDKVKVVILGQD